MKYDFNQFIEAVYETDDGIEIRRVSMRNFNESNQQSFDTVLNAYIDLFGKKEVDLSGDDLKEAPPKEVIPYIQKWFAKHGLLEKSPIESWFGILMSIKGRVK